MQHQSHTDTQTLPTTTQHKIENEEFPFKEGAVGILLCFRVTVSSCLLKYKNKSQKEFEKGKFQRHVLK